MLTPEQIKSLKTLMKSQRIIWAPHKGAVHELTGLTDKAAYFGSENMIDHRHEEGIEMQDLYTLLKLTLK